MSGSRSPPQSRKPSANLSPAQIRAAIPLLEARIAELRDLSIETIKSHHDPRVLALQSAIEATLDRIFGVGAAEYERLRAATIIESALYAGPASLGSRFRGAGGRPLQDTVRGVEGGRQRAIALLIQELALMKEQLHGDSSTERAIRAYASLDLHPEIARAASELYRDGHYANAIKDAVKALNDLVRMRSGEALDGTTLMQKVFSPNTPTLCFNSMADQSDRDEQIGFMMMFSGAVAGLRNPRAHKLIKDDPERALEFIAFVSLLAKLVDGAKKTMLP
jgi:uncharacterized protein (TIGR02391 family)